MRIDLTDMRDNILDWCANNKTGKEKLIILSIGNDPSSEVYMRNKVKTGEKLGIPTIHIQCGNKAELSEQIVLNNRDETVTGIIVQLPLLPDMNPHEYINRINHKKDVDMLTDYNKTRMFLGETDLLPATATSCMMLLDQKFHTIQGLDICLIGRSDLVNNPLYKALLSKNATVQHCHSKTKDLDVKCRNSDVVITAAGTPNLITTNHISEKTKLIIDVSINCVYGKIRGDVTDDVYNFVPVTNNPKGIGCCTVPNLFYNLIKISNID